MKNYVCFISFVLLFSGSLLFAGELEVGGSVGANLWGDTAGLGLTPEVRWLFGSGEQPLVFGAGALILYNFTNMGGFTQNEVNVLALASADYRVIPKLSLRGQVGVGGGWLGASGGDGSSVGSFYIQPTAGIQYDLGLVSLHLLAGSGLTFVPNAFKNTLCIDLGATYRFNMSSKKRGATHE